MANYLEHWTFAKGINDTEFSAEIIALGTESVKQYFKDMETGQRTFDEIEKELLNKLKHIAQTIGSYQAISKILCSKPHTQEEYEHYKACQLVEYEITNIRSVQAFQNIHGNFDLAHLSKIHKYLFNDLYTFAGQLRDYEFRKNIDYAQGSLFAKPKEIENIIQECSQEIINNNYYQHLEQEPFINKFTELYAKFNYAHPFEEGNGRTLKIMMAQFAGKAGNITFYLTSAKEWNRASYEANPKSFRMFEGYPHPINREANLVPLQNIFRQVLKKRT